MVFHFKQANLLYVVVFLLVADKECPSWEKVCSLSMQLSTDM